MIGPEWCQVRVEVVVLALLCLGIWWAEGPVFDLMLSIVGVTK